MQYDWIGYLAGFFYIICYIPQIYTLHRGKTDKLNIYMIFLQMLGAIGMTTYAILNNLMPIIILNSTATLLLIVISYYTFKNS